MTKYIHIMYKTPFGVQFTYWPGDQTLVKDLHPVPVTWQVGFTAIVRSGAILR